MQGAKGHSQVDPQVDPQTQSQCHDRDSDQAPNLTYIASKPDASDGRMITSGTEATSTLPGGVEGGREVASEDVEEEIVDGSKTSDLINCASSSSSSNSLR